MIYADVHKLNCKIKKETSRIFICMYIKMGMTLQNKIKSKAIFQILKIVFVFVKFNFNLNVFHYPVTDSLKVIQHGNR